MYLCKINLINLFVISLFLIVLLLPAQAADITVGLLSADKALGEVANAAYDWAAQDFKTTMLIVDNTCDCTTNRTKQHLDQFAVLWLFYSETDKLPDAFLSDTTMKRVIGYLEAGGTLFLSALGLHYVADLGIEENGDPRVFQPLGKDPPKIGVTPTAEGKKHPVFKGFDTSGPINLTSKQQAGFTSDFHNFGGKPPGGVILATKTRGGGAGAGERPMIEYEVNKGKILTLGHHNGVYTDKKSKEGDNLRKLTKNVLVYLAENSEFLVVKSTNKLTTAWAKLKK